MLTREQYLAGGCSHSEYYGQFVTSYTKALVLSEFTLVELVEATDPHLNDLKLQRWDTLVPSVRLVTDFKKYGDMNTISGAISTLKETARQIIEETKV